MGSRSESDLPPEPSLLRRLLFLLLLDPWLDFFILLRYRLLQTNVIICDIKEIWFHRNRLQCQRILDQIGKINGRKSRKLM